jgi:REase_AHJR-like
MNNIADSLYDKKIQSTAQELRDNGYKVSIEPSNLDLPFELGGYYPDLIATKGTEGIILEVKTSLSRLPIDRFQEIAEQIATHNGWRFLLVTLDDAIENILPSGEQDLPSWEELKANSSKLDNLIQDSLFEPALLFFSSILEAVLRKRAMNQNIPIWRFPEKNLLNHLFSNGEISMSELDLFKACLDLRNRVAHGISASIDPSLLGSANTSIKALVAKWSQ